MRTGKELDMGSPFDLFSEASHPDYTGITQEQYENRMTLRKAMLRNGFVPIDCEGWHFALEKEPYPDTYFEFPVSAQYLRG
jgi:D-alanyl-D-alanine dipeptidase